MQRLEHVATVGAEIKTKGLLLNNMQKAGIMFRVKELLRLLHLYEDKFSRKSVTLY